jgi:hypothetical protein
MESEISFVQGIKETVAECSLSVIILKRAFSHRADRDHQEKNLDPKKYIATQ